MVFWQRWCGRKQKRSKTRRETKTEEIQRGMVKNLLSISRPISETRSFAVQIQIQIQISFTFSRRFARLCQLSRQAWCRRCQRRKEAKERYLIGRWRRSCHSRKLTLAMVLQVWHWVQQKFPPWHWHSVCQSRLHHRLRHPSRFNRLRNGHRQNGCKLHWHDQAFEKSPSGRTRHLPHSAFGLQGAGG